MVGVACTTITTTTATATNSTTTIIATVRRVVVIFCLALFIGGDSLIVETAATPPNYREACIYLSNSVSCVNKNLTDLPAKLPNWTQSLNLNNNHIRRVNKTALQQLPNLRELKLNKNHIKIINNSYFGKLPKLQVLELSRNQIENITALSFQYLEAVTVLRLRRNRIRKLKDGSFFGLTSIKQLHLDNNLIETISKTWLYSLENLTVLTLSNNRISTIDNDAWEFCKRLVELDLSFNTLKHLYRDSFKELSLLRILNLRNNHISNMVDTSLSQTPNLEVLNLNNNKMSWSIEDANGIFKSLSSLRNFSIANNEIKSINTNAFAGLAQLRYLDLGGNNISSIQLNAFEDLQKLEVLELNTTSLLCDCNLQWFYDFLSARRLNVTTVCSYPDWLHGYSLLNVPANNFTCDNLTKPRLIEEPGVEIMALKNESITLACRAVSSAPSAMVFQWKKDNLELRRANVTVEATTDGNNTESVSLLHISRVQHADAGKYQCVVSNSFGTTYSKKSTISVLIYPAFEQTPSNVTVMAGSTAKLACSATGDPQPQIAWQKDGGNDFPAAHERRVQMMPADDVFFIIGVKLADMGVYTCTAKNPAGQIVAKATLNVVEKPSFVKPMENITVKMGESIVIQCMASGSPKPTIQWFKDDELITASEKHFFTAEDQIMIAVDSMLGDSGNYTCKLNNTLGVETGYSIVVVSARNMPYSDLLGIIIISVVSCAVFTSIIWVVIIYQTRKRMTTASMRNIPDTVLLEFPDKLGKHYTDNTSEHSSCKDSGTGDSAKRSNDDLMPQDEFTLIINDTNTRDNGVGTMRAASLVYLPPGECESSGASSPLLQHGSAGTSGVRYARSTNHERQQLNDDEIEEKSKDGEVVVYAIVPATQV